MNGAALPAGSWAEPAGEEGRICRIYMEDVFWGLVYRQGQELIWRAQIAPEDEA